MTFGSHEVTKPKVGPKVRQRPILEWLQNEEVHVFSDMGCMAGDFCVHRKERVAFQLHGVSDKGSIFGTEIFK